MLRNIGLVALLVSCAASAAHSANENEKAGVGAINNPHNCQVVERSQDAANAGLSSTVTAGNNQVTARSSGGQSVTVQSGNGSVSSSVATTGDGRGSTTVTTSNGNCTIYVDPGHKKEK